MYKYISNLYFTFKHPISYYLIIFLIYKYMSDLYFTYKYPILYRVRIIFFSTVNKINEYNLSVISRVIFIYIYFFFSSL